MKNLLFTIITLLSFSHTNLLATELEKEFWKDYQALLNNILVEKEYKYLGQTFTHAGVNYQKIYDDDNELLINEQLAKLNNFSSASLREDSQNTQLAFWINIYNFFTLLEIKRHYPISSMKKIGWDNKVVTLKDRVLTLDDVEHKIIRPLKEPREPRIHFAINCASVSCPTLLKEIYQGDLLDQQLDFAVKNAFKNPLNLRIQEGFFGDKMYATKIFSWFDEDFGNTDDIVKFIHNHSLPVYKKYQTYGSLKYNWDINTPENISKNLTKLIDELEK